LGPESQAGLFDAAHYNVADAVARKLVQVDDHHHFFGAHGTAIGVARHLRQIGDDVRGFTVDDAHDLAHGRLARDYNVIVGTRGPERAPNAIGHHQHRGKNEHYQSNTRQGQERGEPARRGTA
jgi:hypothetical protein